MTLCGSFCKIDIGYLIFSLLHKMWRSTFITINLILVSFMVNQMLLVVTRITVVITN